MSVRELELDLDAFEGPFDLLLTLVLKEEVPLGEDCKDWAAKLNDRERIEMKKFCRWDRRHTLHKETR